MNTFLSIAYKNGGKVAACTMAMLFVLASISYADTISLTYEFTEPQIEMFDDGVYVSIEGLRSYGKPNEPVLPLKDARVLIPQGHVVRDIKILTPEKVYLGSFKVMAGKYPKPISKIKTFNKKPPSRKKAIYKAIYKSEKPFPKDKYRKFSIQKYRGYEILPIEINPVEYIPKTGELYYYPSIEVEITTVLDENKTPHPFLRKSEKDKKHIKAMVDNPAQADAYVNELPLKENPVNDTLISTADISSAAGPDEIPLGTNLWPDPSKQYDYVIITSPSLASSFTPLIQSKIDKGLTATTVSVSGIFSGFSGADGPEKIRNFISWAYVNWDTEYVLLGGDTTIVPYRGVYGRVNTSTPTIDANIPCDMYYGNLDGPWDGDGDGIFGEINDGEGGGDVDLIAEVFIGRAPVNTSAEVSNFINKTLAYEQSPTASYATLAGELLWELDPPPHAWGAQRHEHLVAPEFPEWTNVTPIYQRDTGLSAYISSIRNKLNSGNIPIIAHIGHTSEGSLMKLSISDILSLTNIKYYAVYSGGCYSGAFDYNDSIGEHIVKSEHGAYAFIGNSRYGWGLATATPPFGPSDRFEGKFFDKLYNRTPHLAEVLQKSKEPFIGYCYTYNTPYRWVYFNLNLLGDPEISPIGYTHMVKITDKNGNPVPRGTQVSLSREGIVLVSGNADSQGRFFFKFGDNNSGLITISAHNYEPDSFWISKQGVYITAALHHQNDGVWVFDGDVGPPAPLAAHVRVLDPDGNEIYSRDTSLVDGKQECLFYLEPPPPGESYEYTYIITSSGKFPTVIKSVLDDFSHGGITGAYLYRSINKGGSGEKWPIPAIGGEEPSGKYWCGTIRCP